MNRLLNEIYKINKIISGNPINEGSSQDYIKRIKDILSFNGMLTPSVEQNLNAIIKIADERIIDFDLLDRGLKKVLLKKL